MAAKKSASATTARSAGPGRFTVIGGVRVKLAPAKRLLPREEETRIRQAVKNFYAEKKAR